MPAFSSNPPRKRARNLQKLSAFYGNRSLRTCAILYTEASPPSLMEAGADCRFTKLATRSQIYLRKLLR